ncbi:hypothetical protein MNBD_NITROSPINAE04-228 [hydrothermal vent metagenome]|uniref:Protein BatD n=1 Tax=hydrothermal vent metagenome TaxID=652676 RepID=A0A3B1BLA0_9ZZZZ
MTRLFLIAVALIWAAPVFASDDISIRATASPDRLPPGYSFRLEITVEGKGIHSLPDPNMPRLKSFDITGRSSSQQVSMSGLSITVSKTIAYRVLAPKEGKFQIPPITLAYGGKTYKTDPIDITVDSSAPIPQSQKRRARQGGPPFSGFLDPFAAAPGAGGGSFFDRRSRIENNDLMVKMDVDKKTATLYEPIIATFSFYRAVQLWENPNFTKPEFEGFWAESLPFEDGKNEQITREPIDGKNYIVTKVRYALIPLSPGKKIVDQATLSISEGPWSERIRLKTKPIPIEIRPFPEDGKPINFSGAVGKYTISSEASPATAKVNDGMTLRLTIKGEGYLKPAAVPLKPSIDGMEVYDPKVTDSVDKSGGSIVSTKIIEYPMIPREEGKKRINPFTVWTYDPDSGKYILLKTSPIEINILAGPTGAKAADVATRSLIAPLKADILYIKPDKDILEDFGAPLHKSWFLWAILLAPFPVLAIGWAVAERRKRFLTDKVYFRSYHAAKTAKAMLVEAGKIKEPAEFYAALDKAVRGYLADKWNLPAPSITKQLVKKRLERSGAENSNGIVELFEAVEIARYARHEINNMSLHLKKAGELIEWMEKHTV